MRKSEKEKKRKKRKKGKEEMEEEGGRRIKRKKERRGEERRNGGVTYLESVDKLYYKSVNSIAIDNECSRIGLLPVKLKKHDGLVTDYIRFLNTKSDQYLLLYIYIIFNIYLFLYETYKTVIKLIQTKYSYDKN